MAENEYTIKDPILAQAWEALIKQKYFTFINGELVVDAAAAKRIYAVIGAGYELQDVNKEVLTKKDFEKMYLKKTSVFLQYPVYESHQAKPKINITINWKEAIDVEDFDKDQLNSEEEETASLKQVVYIFVGYNSKGEMGVDVGQTSRTLKTRTSEHTDGKDYLEGYPNKQVVYCGNVTCARTIDRAMLEQIEGIFIQYLNGCQEGKYHLCNDTKLHNSKSPYIIGHIYNEDTPNDLSNILPTYIAEEDTPKRGKH